LEQADLIQKHIEKKLQKLYKIDETIGKSLITNDDELPEDDTKERKSMIISDDENSHLSADDITNRPTSDTENRPDTETTNIHKSPNDNNVMLSPSINTNNGNSPSSPPVPSPPSKENPSPGEITKATSPSSLSEASPILD
jgi:hypothetical protein